MRRYTDSEGRPWDVVLGRESFGALLALFVPAAGNRAPPRQSMLGAESRQGAATELADLEPAELDALFERSQPKETG
ncbi:MAG: hypothetical protein KY466_02055 [Gemmatimonadetes bacterium]|nr:hypothetical protein [Gemmatimonadota bacterium]